MKKLAPWLISLCLIGWAVAKMLPPKPTPGLDTDNFARLPVLVGGRVMPMDTLARISLLALNHFGSYRTSDGKMRQPTEWLLDVLMMPERADSEKVFYISNPEVLDLVGFSDRKETLYSYNDLKGSLTKIDEQSALAAQVPSQTRNPFQREIVKLRDGLLIYLRLKSSIQVEGSSDFAKEVNTFASFIGPGLQSVRARAEGKPFDQNAFQGLIQFTQRYQSVAQVKYAYAFPNPNATSDADRWQQLGDALLGSIGTGKISYPLHAYSLLASNYRKEDTPAFNSVLHDYQAYLEKTVPTELTRPRIEFLFNHASPFLQAMVLYLAVFVCALLSWLFWPKTLGKIAIILLVAAFVIHSGALLTRIYLQGRPPVTNLYSSAIFVGWGIVVLCLFLERMYRNGIASICASAAGFTTLLIAYNLQLDGDTLEMLRAVLDTNFWLATHVVVVTLGYSATFLAGLLGIIFIVRGLVSRSFSVDLAKSLGRMTYGVVCFATLFSFVGTILGGIWADQAWGRFWGWDPKENGAVLIVLWNAIILHARWGGYVRERGIAVMAVFGNIITSLSWFGVNMLGVGLHSYGFMDQAFGVLLAFIASQFTIMGLGLIPQRYWRGIRARTANVPADPATASVPLTVT
ncbi:MAG TPA: cytochrome c biogenesis protein CcsA [Chthoniobacterales bacterium]|nr:cytochrome c biogenesis protein CcsA [Chthoniobacterales bacterium]